MLDIQGLALSIANAGSASEVKVMISDCDYNINVIDNNIDFNITTYLGFTCRT